MPSRKLADLDGRFKPIAEEILARAAARGCDLLVTCTFRSNSEQAYLYAAGRTRPGKIVTRCKPGDSAHNCGMAIDVVPIIAGKPVWAATHPHWQIYGECVRESGAVWGGDFRSLRDLPHAEMANWKSYWHNYGR